ncbi:hypothetical protein FBZ81_10383 [Azospirillum brasilense]|nr:hypothetical protein FBZ81_10383 [Azospirillum brasilense]
MSDKTTTRRSREPFDVRPSANGVAVIYRED